MKKAHDELQEKVRQRAIDLERAKAELKQEREEHRQSEERQQLAVRIFELLNQPGERTNIIQSILLLIHESTGFDAVGVRLQEGGDFPYYETRGFPLDFVEAERSLCARDGEGNTVRDINGSPVLECLCGNIIRGRTDPALPFYTPNGSFWTNSTTELLTTATEKDLGIRTRNRCNTGGYESVALIPLHSGGMTIGLLQLNDRRKGMFTPEKITYFEGIGASIGISLERTIKEKISQENEKKYRDIFNNIVDVYSETDIDGNIIEMSPSIEKYTGYRREDLIGKPVLSFYVNPERRGELLRELSLKDTIHDFEIDIRDKDGRSVPFSVTSKLERDGQGNPVKVIAMIRDITERKQMEKERQEHLRFFENMDRVNRAIQGTNDLERMMQDLLDVVLSVFGCDRAFLLYPCDPESPIWTVPMERNKPEYPGAYALKLEMPMDPQVADVFRIQLAADRPVAFGPDTVHALPGDVSEQFSIKSLLSMAIHPRIGSPWQFGIHQCSHVRTWNSEEKRLFQEIGRRLGDGLTTLLSYRDLRKSEKFLENIVDNIPNMIFVKEARDLSFVKFNKAGEKLVGYSRDELLGKTDYDFFPREEADFFTAKDRRVLDAKALVDIPEETIHTGRNEERILHTKKIPILDEAGTPRYLLGISEDITERKQAEEKLKEYQEHLEELVEERTAELSIAKTQAEAANQAKSDFLSSMSHELRTPLNNILGYTQILKKQKNLTDRQREQLETIQSSGKHLLTLISDILDLSRIEAKKEQLEFKVFNLGALIHEILSSAKIRAREKGIYLDYEEKTDMPEIVQGDERKLRQVLLNLMSNAIKYTKEGGVTLCMSWVSGQQSAVSSPKNLIFRFEIGDTGIGIPEDKREAIFEPFAQIEREGKTTEGTGLGLSICRRLVDLMDGRLFVESKVGEGSTFTVEVEMEVVEVVSDAVRKPERSFAGYTGERKKILIADDNITNLSMLVEMLEPLGFETEAAENGEEAVKAVTKFRPDLILMDLLMPVMDGDEALQRIRNGETVSSVKVIGVSAAAADRERMDLFAVQCDDIISKPVNIEELLEKLREHLHIEWIEEEPEKAADTETVAESEEIRKPHHDILDEIAKKAEMGDFGGVERILDELEVEDAVFNSFCNRIRTYTKNYDDEGILEFVKSRI